MKLLFVASGTGGTQIFNIMVKTLQDYLGLDIKYIAFTEVSNRVAEGSEYIPDYDEALNESYKFNPDFVFMEVSNPSDSYKALIKKLHKDYKMVSVHDVWNTGDDFYDNNFEPDIITVPTRRIKHILCNKYDRDKIYLYTNPTFSELSEVNSVSSSDDTLRVFYCSQGKCAYEEERRAIKVLKTYLPNHLLTVGLHPNEVEEEIPEDIRNSGAIFTRLNGKLPIEYDLILGKESTVQLKTFLLQVPTIFIDDQLEDNIQRFSKNLYIDTNPTFSSFTSCLDEHIHLERLYVLISKLRNMKREVVSHV